MKTRRFDQSQVMGFVNFPIDTLKNDGQGGQFVRLIVFEPKDKEPIIPCCGGYQRFDHDEEFLGDDETIQNLNIPKTIDEHKAQQSAQNDIIKKYFPRYFENGNECQFASIPCLAIHTIGATGWSNSTWICRFEDLNPKGKQFVELLKQLYPNCIIRLLTFLDT